MNKIFTFLFFGLLLSSEIWGQSFTRERIIPIITPETRSIADLDNDGDLDILISSDYELAWYENLDGLGTYGEVKIFGLPPFIGPATAAGDWDNDGDLDVISISEVEDKIYMFENIDGAGHFSSALVLFETIGSINSPRELTITDFDGDGFLDLFYLIGSSSLSNLVLKRGLGVVGEWGPSSGIGYQIDKSMHNYSFGDLDGDGDKDVVIGYSGVGSDNLYWFENIDEQDSFSDPILIEEGTVNYNVPTTVIDLDGDGNNDIISATVNGITWYPNTSGNGEFLEKKFINDDVPDSRAVKAIDIDNDGDIDIVGLIGVSYEEGRVSFFENIDGLGTFGDAQDLNLNEESYSDIEPADIDNDGDLDLFTFPSGWIENNNQFENFPYHKFISKPGEMTSIALGDVNADGKLDIVTGVTENSDSISLHINIDGDNQFLSPILLPAHFTYVQLNDMDGDGDLDILGREKYWFAPQIAWLENIDGQGTFDNMRIIEEEGLQYFSELFWADLDSDGDNDIITKPNSSDDIGWYENIDGLGNFSSFNPLQNSPGFSKGISVIDFNNDNHLDIIFADGPIKLLLNEGNASSFQLQTITMDLPSAVDFIKSGDIDNDGIQDFIGVTNNGVIYKFLNSGESGVMLFPEIIFSLNSDITGFDFADFDNDDDLDILLNINGYTRIIENTDGLGTYENSVYFGLNTHSAEAGDMDNDGDLDVVRARTYDAYINYNQLDEPHLLGRVFWDENENGIYDVDEVGIDNSSIQVSPSGTSIFTRPNGTYSSLVGTGYL